MCVCPCVCVCVCRHSYVSVFEYAFCRPYNFFSFHSAYLSFFFLNNYYKKYRKAKLQLLHDFICLVRSFVHLYTEKISFHLVFFSHFQHVSFIRNKK